MVSWVLGGLVVFCLVLLNLTYVFAFGLFFNFCKKKKNAYQHKNKRRNSKKQKINKIK